MSFQDLLQRNRRYADDGRQQGVPLMPRHGLVVVTCLDPRVDPAAFLGLELGDAAVLRNAGGRVNDAVLSDLAFTAALAGHAVPDGPLFEIALVQHSDCGTAALAREPFRRSFAASTGLDERALADEAVTDPDRTVRTDVDRVLACRWLSGWAGRLRISGHVYDLDTGLVRTVIPIAPIGGLADRRPPHLEHRGTTSASSSPPDWRPTRPPPGATCSRASCRTSTGRRTRGR